MLLELASKIIRLTSFVTYTYICDDGSQSVLIRDKRESRIAENIIISITVSIIVVLHL